MKRTVLVTAVMLLVSAFVVQGGAGSVASSSRALVKTAYNKKLGKKILVGSTRAPRRETRNPVTRTGKDSSASGTCSRPRATRSASSVA